MTTLKHTYSDARDEIEAYDLLEMLLAREGVTTVLATLRAWHLLLDLNTPQQRARRTVAAVTGVYQASSI